MNRRACLVGIFASLAMPRAAEGEILRPFDGGTYTRVTLTDDKTKAARYENRFAAYRAARLIDEEAAAALGFDPETSKLTCDPLCDEDGFTCYTIKVTAFKSTKWVRVERVRIA